MITAVLFDVDGVLIDVDRADIATYKKMLEAADYTAPPTQRISEVTHLPLWEGIKRLLDGAGYEEVTRVRDILLEDGDSHRNYVQYPDGLTDILSHLSSQYRLGIVTSRFRSGLDALFDAYAIRDLFECVVAYEDTGEHKPHPDPLLLAADQMNVTPSDTVYVGDMDYDMQAAASAGMKSILVSPQYIPGVDMHIDRLGQLPDAIAKL